MSVVVSLRLDLAEEKNSHVIMEPSEKEQSTSNFFAKLKSPKKTANKELI
jgi:hypothetical protein